MLNKRALLKLGWTPSLIESVLGAPDRVEVHRRGLRQWTEHLYARDRVDQGAQSDLFRGAQSRRRERIARAAERRDAIPEQYRDWRHALPDAARYLFSLNRYAKHSRCSELHKSEIYRLKNELIAAMYRHGYCTAAWVHVFRQDAQICRECAGDGEYCDHCGGSGQWRPARTLQFWCFQFCIDRVVYCWHQPANSIDFRPVETVPPQDWTGGFPVEKPVLLAPGKFALAKDLLRWVIDRASDEPSGAAVSGSSELAIPERQEGCLSF